MKIRYAEYKDSGIEWIGLIPRHWSLTKGKYCSTFRMGQTILKEDLIEDGEYPVFSATEGDHHFGRINNPIFTLNEGDIVIPARGNSIGHVAIVSEKAVCTQTTIANSILKEKINSSFLFFYYKAHRTQLFPFDHTAIPQITVDQVKQNLIPLPPLSEQEAIVRYLDDKTSQIDSLLSLTEKKIELLKEKRTALINHAVTKGLHPDAPMKESGIEWIGEIPRHWESWKISHAFNQIGSGATPESGNAVYHENGIISWLNTGDLNDGILDSCSKKITYRALEDYSALKVFPKGSLAIAMYGATIGKTAILNFETTANQACCVFGFSEIIDLNFLQYWFISSKEQIINLAIGGGQPNISQAILKDIRLWCPDFSEQEAIVRYLDEKTSQIDSLIAIEQKRMDTLKEYRQSLISEVVTGKVKVAA